MKAVREKTVAFIVARLNSSRFPAKQLRRIGDRTLLDWTLLHLRKSKEIDEIVLATVAERANEPLLQYAVDNALSCFRYEGDPNRVTTRLCCAAREFNAEICVLVSGDCPLMDGESIDMLIGALRKDKEKDLIITPAQSNGKVCMLQGAMVARRRAWIHGEQLSLTPELKEHHFPVFYRKKEYFNTLSYYIPKPIYADFHRLSIDTYADYRFFLNTYDRLRMNGKEFTLEETVSLLEQEPDLKNINKHVHQRKVAEIIPNILLFSLSPGGADKGYAIWKSRITDIALNLTESQGWPVHFLTNDSALQKELSFMGIRHTSCQNIEELSDIVTQHRQPLHIIIDNSRGRLTDIEQHHILNFSAASLILLEDADGTERKKADTLFLPTYERNTLLSSDALSKKAKNFIQVRIDETTPRDDDVL
jgi:spore coat polysaccharide biosynthesis protein SpsF